MLSPWDWGATSVGWGEAGRARARRSRCCSPTRPLLTTHYSLLTTHYSLLTTYYSLLTTHYSLLTTYYLLPTTYYLPLTTYYLLLITYYLSRSSASELLLNTMKSFGFAIALMGDHATCRLRSPQLIPEDVSSLLHVNHSLIWRWKELSQSFPTPCQRSAFPTPCQRAPGSRAAMEGVFGVQERARNAA